MSALVSIQNLQMGFHTFNGYSEILKGIDLDIYPGEKVALVGESGSGKSLTARTILGIADYPNVEITGTIAYGGKNLLENKEKDWDSIRGREMTMIFQDPTNSLNPTYTIGKQIVDAMMTTGLYDNSKHCLSVMAEEMRKISIAAPERILESYPFQLSGGLNQRIAIVMALLNNPKLLLADEPGTALDVTVQAQTLALMDTLIQQKKSSCLFISHNLGVVRNFADTVYVIHKGRIVESASTESLFENPKHPYTKALVGAVPTLDTIDFKTVSHNEQDFYDAPPVHHPCMNKRETKHA